MDEDRTENTVKSILRQASQKRDRRKRLSFAAAEIETREDSESPERADPITIAEEFPRHDGTLLDPDKLVKRLRPDNSNASAISYDVHMESDVLEVNPICKSLRISPAGLYYVPSNRKNRQYSESLPIIPMKENNRHVFKTAINSISSTTAKVLILGNKCDGEKIRDNLLSLHETRRNNWSLKWTLQLDIQVEESPSSAICNDANYFIFLAHLDALDSLASLSQQLTKIRTIGALPSLCGIVLYMTSAQGTCRNVITHEQLGKFFKDHQLAYIHWSKPDKDHYLKVLHSIQESLGYNSGTSLLTKGALRWISEIVE